MPRVLPLVTPTLAAVALVATSLLAPAAQAPGIAPAPPAGAVERVLVISLDGLNPTALRRLGSERTPVLHALMDTGAWTLEARSSVEGTFTLPNHTSMVTGRRIDASRGGHGVTWNDERRHPATVQEAAGGPVESVFSTLHSAGLSTGLFVTKRKFSLFTRSWPNAIDRYTQLEEKDDAIARAARRDLVRIQRPFTFVHLGDIDATGHDTRFMGPEYLEAVAGADRNVGRILEGLRRAGTDTTTLVVVTADHGGKGHTHYDPDERFNYRVPFFVRGPGVPAGVDLYALNPTYADPGLTRPAYTGVQPIRNGAVANLVTDALGVGPVPGSQIDADQDLEVFAPAP